MKTNNRCTAAVATAGIWQTIAAKTSALHRRRNHRSKTVCLAMVLVLALAGPVFHANAQTEVPLHSFGGLPDGENPRAGLVLGSDGNFYGTTYSGGTNSSGSVFRLTPGGGYASLYSFGDQPLDGTHPSAGLVQGSDGYLYGTTVNGGTNTFGTVFRISHSGSYSNLYSFQGPPNDGDGPGVGLTRGNDGNFYGVTMGGGAGNSGTVFRVTPDGTETMLYSFAGFKALVHITYSQISFSHTADTAIQNFIKANLGLNSVPLQYRFHIQRIAML